jgi:hypothetical protein
MLILMVGLHSDDHGSLIEQGEVVDAPRNSTDLGTNLGDYFSYYCFEVFSVVYCASKNDLRDDWNFLEHESFQVRV